MSILSTGMADRLAERQAIQRNLRNRKVMWAVGIVAGLGALVWLVFGSSVLALKSSEITVNGTGDFVSTSQILDAVAPWEGTPLATLPMGQVEQAVLGVKNVRDMVHTRKWPQGLTITIQERVPVAAVPDQGAFALLDIDGQVVARQEAAPPELPLVELALSKSTEKTLTSVLQILEQLPVELLAEVESISARSQDSVNLVLRNGIMVHWGSSEETVLKLEILRVLLESARDDGTKVIDLSAPTFPITK